MWPCAGPQWNPQAPLRPSREPVSGGADEPLSPTYCLIFQTAKPSFKMQVFLPNRWLLCLKQMFEMQT